MALASPVAAQDLPPGTQTFADGRTPIEDVFGAYSRLADAGWRREIITQSQPGGTVLELPVIALLSPNQGPAAWFIAGIHGEEPAGPVALAQSVDVLARLGTRIPVVVLPLLNPHGYTRNWRYLNRPDWQQGADIQSVGDASHRLSATGSHHARELRASSPEAEAITRFVLTTSRAYPPRYSFDLHEDNLIDAAYVYSQGKLGVDDPLAALAVTVLAEQGIPVQRSGETRFGEVIANGIIGPVEDSSLDELMSAEMVVIGNRFQTGPRAHTVLVFETPARSLDLATRVAAHKQLLESIAAKLETGALSN